MAQWQQIDAFLHALSVRIGPPTFGQTIGGIHSLTSEHYPWNGARARDYGTLDSDAPAVARALIRYAEGADYILDELFFSPLNVFYKRGNPFTPDPGLYKQHLNHCHAAMRPGATFPPPTPPIATPQRKGNMLAYDSISGGYWETDDTGAVFAKDGAPYLGGLNTHPDWHAGGPNAPVIGVCFWKGDGSNAKGNGYVIATRPPGSQSPSDYRFPRDGSLAR